MAEFLYDERPPLTPAEIRQMFEILTKSVETLQKQIDLVNDKTDLLNKQNVGIVESISATAKSVIEMANLISGISDRALKP